MPDTSPPAPANGHMPAQGKAVHVAWWRAKANGTPISEGGPTLSAFIGRVVAAYRPGILKRLKSFVVKPHPESDTGAEASTSSLSDRLLQWIRYSSLQVKVDSFEIAVLSHHASSALDGLVLKTGEFQCWLESGVPSGGGSSAEQAAGVHACLSDCKLLLVHKWSSQEGVSETLFHLRDCHLSCLELPDSALLGCLRLEEMQINLTDSQGRRMLAVLQAAHEDLKGQRLELELLPPGGMPSCWLELQMSRLQAQAPLQGSPAAVILAVPKAFVGILGSRLSLDSAESGHPALHISSGPQSQLNEAMTSASATWQRTLVLGRVSTYLGTRTLQCLSFFRQAFSHSPSSKHPNADVSMRADGSGNHDRADVSVDHARADVSVDHDSADVSADHESADVSVDHESADVSVDHDSADVSTVQHFDMRVGSLQGVVVADHLGHCQSDGQPVLSSLHWEASALDIASASAPRRKGVRLEAAIRSMKIHVGQSNPLQEGLVDTLPPRHPSGEPLVELTEVHMAANSGPSSSLTTDLSANSLNLHLSRPQHVLLLRCLSDFSTVPVKPKGPSTKQKTTATPYQVQLSVQKSLLQLALWKDSEDVPESSSSMLVVIAEGTQYTERADPAKSRSLVLDYLEVYTQREGEGSEMLPILRPMVTSAAVASKEKAPVLVLSTGTGQAQLELGPLDWRLDGRLLAELVTVIYERRKLFPNVGGPDALPGALEVRIVTGLARLQLLSSLEAFSAASTSPALHKVQKTGGTASTTGVGLLLTAEHSVSIFHSGIGADARRWTGVHDSSKPGHTDPSSLHVQDIDFSIIGFNITSISASSLTPTLFFLDNDIHVGTQLLGCPFPLRLYLNAKEIDLQVSEEGLFALRDVFFGLVAGWSSTWPLRERLAGPPMPSDDLRAGVFSRAPGGTQKPDRMEISWGDEADPPGSGWVSWRYPYPRDVTLVIISPSDGPLVLPTPTAVTLSFFDTSRGSFVDVAPVVVAEQPVVVKLEPLSTVPAAELWKLSWTTLRIKIKGQEKRASGDQILKAVQVLRLVQVNPTLYPGVTSPSFPLPLVAPLLLEVRAEALHVAVVKHRGAKGGAEQELGVVHLGGAELGLHWWGSTTTALGVRGALSVEYVDSACATYETLIEPSDVVLALDHSPLQSIFPPGTPETPPPGPSVVFPRAPPSQQGVALAVKVTSEISIRLQESAVLELNRVAALFKPTCKDELLHSGYLIENCCPVPLALGQAGIDEELTLVSSQVAPFVWKAPPSLCPQAKRLLRIALKQEASSAWCQPFGIDDVSIENRRLTTPNPSVEARVAVFVSKREGCRSHITVRPACCLVNLTSSMLVLRYKGVVLRGPQGGQEQELTLALPPGSERELFCCAVKGGDDAPPQSGTLQVLLGGGAAWSDPVSLPAEETPLEAQLLQSSEEGSAAVWMQAVTEGQRRVKFWPLFMVYNRMYRALDIGITTGSSETSICTIQSDVETALPVGTYGTQEISFRTSKGSWSTPLLLTRRLVAGLGLGGWASASPLRGRGSQDIPHVPRLGTLQHLQDLDSVLLAEQHSQYVPTVVLSLLPHAVLHNNLPLPLALLVPLPGNDSQKHVRAAPSASLPFSWQKHLSRRVLLGVPEAKGPRWSESLSVEEEGVLEVEIDEEEGVMKFLVAVEKVKYGGTGSNKGEAHTCYHLTTYPSVLLSNSTTHNLSLCQEQPPYPPGTQQAPLLYFRGPPKEPLSVAIGVCLKKDSLPSACSERISLTKPVTQRQLLLGPPEHPPTCSLTYSILFSRKQAHLILYEDVQPSCIVRNDSPVCIEVRRVGDAESAISIPPSTELKYNWGAVFLTPPESKAAPSWGAKSLGGSLAGASKEYDEEMDEALLQQMRGGKLFPQLELRITPGGSWCSSFDVTSAAWLVCDSEETSVEVQVLKQGATCYVWVDLQGGGSRGGKLGGAKPAPPPRAVEIFVMCLRVAFLDDERGRLSRKLESLEVPCPAEVLVLTIDNIHFSFDSAIEEGAIEGGLLPALAVKKLRLTLGGLQLDNLLEHSELPVVFTSNLSMGGPLATALLPAGSAKGSAQSAVLVAVEACKPLVSEEPTWLPKVCITIQPLLVSVDDSFLRLAANLRQVLGGSPGGTPECQLAVPYHQTWPQHQPAPVRTQDLSIAAPQVYIECLDVSKVKVVATVHVSYPLVVDARGALIRLTGLRLKDLLFPPAVLARGVLAHYVTEGILNAPRVLGSLDLLFNPTGLAQSVSAGLRDLLHFPLAGITEGPLGFFSGLGYGSASLVHHMSFWTLSSIAGFSSSLSRILDRQFIASPPRTAPPTSGVTRRGGSGFVVGVGKGLVGAVAGPVSGALQLVAHTSQSLLGVGGYSHPLTRARSSSALLGESSDTVALETGLRLSRRRGSSLQCHARSTSWRYQHHRAIEQEVYVSHVRCKWASLIGRGDSMEGPRSIQQPVLVLTGQSIVVLEYEGCVVAAKLALSGLVLDEDVVECAAVLVEAALEGTQVFVRFQERSWATWLPNLRRALAATKGGMSECPR